MYENEPITIKSKNLKIVETNNYALNCACHISKKIDREKEKQILKKSENFL